MEELLRSLFKKIQFAKILHYIKYCYGALNAYIIIMQVSLC